MRHLFGNILTHYAPAANNFGESEGNTTQLSKLIWKHETHTIVSAQAIRWALRYYWQCVEIPVNRKWNEDTQDFAYQNLNFDPLAFIDDDVLGFMQTEAAKIDQSNKVITKGTAKTGRGQLDVDHAVSTLPYFSETFFNTKSGKKNNQSLYNTEVHATRYQYCFAIVPEYLKVKSRVLNVLDGVVSLNRVGGNHGRFLYDFSPESIILRWTHDFAPRFLYSFEEDEECICIPTLIQKISSGDIDPKELWIGGCNLGSELKDLGVNVFSGVKATVTAIKNEIVQELNLEVE